MNNIFDIFRGLLRMLLSGEVSVLDFCFRYERLWNSPISTEGLDPVVAEVLSKLFDEVALHSPFPRDQWDYPKYRSDEEIVECAAQALRFLETRSDI